MPDIFVITEKKQLMLDVIIKHLSPLDYIRSVPKIIMGEFELMGLSINPGCIHSAIGDFVEFGLMSLTAMTPTRKKGQVGKLAGLYKFDRNRHGEILFIPSQNVNNHPFKTLQSKERLLARQKAGLAKIENHRQWILAEEEKQAVIALHLRAIEKAEADKAAITDFDHQQLENG